MAKIAKIKSLIFDCFSVSSADGLATIAKNKRFLIRMLWIISLLCSLSTCLYMIIGVVNNYLKYKVVTEMDTIIEQYSQFPTVSICNSGNGFGNFPSQYGTLEGLNQTLLNCYFNGEKYCLHDPGNFFQPFNDSMYGNCYRFNSGYNFTGNKVDILNSTYSGLQYGLVLDFMIPFNAYVYDYLQLIIQIHNSTMTYPSLFNNEIYLSSGSRSDFILSRQFISKLPAPYSQCIEDASSFTNNKTIIDFILDSNRSYSQTECMQFKCY